MTRTAAGRLVALLAGAFIVSAALCALAAAPMPLKMTLAPVIRNAACGLFLAAGAVRFVMWRNTRDAATARAAAALLALGGALLSTPGFDALVHDGAVVGLESSGIRLVLALPITALAVAGARHDVRLMRQTLAVLAGVSLALPALVGLLATTAPAGETQLGLWLSAHTVTAAAWSALALQAWQRRERNPLAGPAVLGLVLMAVADALKAWSVTDARAPHGLAGAVQLAAAVVAASTALRGLTSSVRTDEQGVGDLTRALVDTERRLRQVEQRQRTRLHDARSAVLGVAAASRLLAPVGPSVIADAGRLQALLGAELERLRSLLDGDDLEPVVDFDVAEALAPVVHARRLDGASIDLQCPAVHACGQPHALATAVDNLLRNAGRHAPGARVLVAVRLVGGEVAVAVCDDGPGIPMHEQAEVLEAGVRGSAARGDGDGLGLASAAKIMTAQGGSLTLSSLPGAGTTVVLRMPAAALTALAS